MRLRTVPSPQTPHNALRIIEKAMRQDALNRGYSELPDDVEKALSMLWDLVVLGSTEPEVTPAPREEVDDRDEATA
jgi:hypothetical protein